MRTAIRLLCLCFLLSIITIDDCFAERKPKVLVLHSYHQGLEWTDNITKGIQSVFLSFHKYYEVHYEYLDTKRNSGDDYMSKVAEFLLTKYMHAEYAAIIVSDNNALRLINEGKIYFPGNPPVIFCGINNYSDDLTENIPNVTGVVETTDHESTLDLMMALHPERRHVIVVLDKTPTGEAIREKFRGIEALYEGRLEFTFLRDFTLEEIPARLAKLGDGDIIYILTFNRDRNDNFISYTEGIEMISQNTTVPIYGSWDFYLGKGIVGGRITSGKLQGQEAAKRALRILQGEPVSKMGVVTDSATQYMFDYKYMEKFGIKSSSLPHGSLIINAPPTTYEKYSKYLITLTVLLIIVVFFLTWKYRRQQIDLLAKQRLAQELEEKVKERTVELEVLNRELQRLSNLDGLTQLYNRRYFDNGLKKEINRLQRLSEPISLLICDIDYFKKYNDAYGHLAGDDCIRTVAELINKHCQRVSDITARYGGEEFGVILPNTGLSDAVDIAEAIRKDVELEDIPHEASLIKKVVSISIGVASMVPDIRTTPSMLIALADKALYESKNNGRDQVTFKAG